MTLKMSACPGRIYVLKARGFRPSASILHQDNKNAQSGQLIHLRYVFIVYCTEDPYNTSREYVLEGGCRFEEMVWFLFFRLEWQTVWLQALFFSMFHLKLYVEF